jgi:hypothetical protein
MEPRNSPTATPSAYYGASIGSFAKSSPASIVGRVAESSEYTIEPTSAMLG